LNDAPTQDVYDDRAVMFDLPFPLELPATTDASTPQITVEGTIPAMVQVVLRPNERIPYRATGFLEGGDPYGRYAYTSVFVRFHVPSSPSAADWDDRELVDHAVAAVNRLLEHYRDIAEQPLIKPVAAKHIAHFKLMEKRPGREFSVRHYSCGSGPMYLNVEERQDAFASQLQGRLLLPGPPPFLRSLYLDLKARMEVGDYRQAVVEGAIIFEAWLRRRLVEAFSLLGMPKEQVARQFVNSRGFPKSVTTLATRELRAAIGLDFEASPEFPAWEAARDLRNAIVHGEREDVTLDEARNALDGFLHPIDRVQQAMSRRFPGWSLGGR
jgi:hypothetical protein